MDKILEVLKTELPKINYKYSFINSGGCGFFAALLADELSKANVTNKTVFLSSFMSADIDVRKMYKVINENSKLTLEEFNSNGVYCAHMMVIVRHNKKYYYLDSTGVYENNVPENGTMLVR
jgi:hypothetical protein